jgi:hypothetical protein
MQCPDADERTALALASHSKNVAAFPDNGEDRNWFFHKWQTDHIWD